MPRPVNILGSQGRMRRRFLIATQQGLRAQRGLSIEAQGRGRDVACRVAPPNPAPRLPTLHRAPQPHITLKKTPNTPKPCTSHGQPSIQISLCLLSHYHRTNSIPSPYQLYTNITPSSLHVRVSP